MLIIFWMTFTEDWIEIAQKAQFRLLGADEEKTETADEEENLMAGVKRD